MSTLSDTSPEAEAVLRDVSRTMPFERKWRQLGKIYATGRHLHHAGLRLRNPTVTPQDVVADWVRVAGLEEYLHLQRGKSKIGYDDALRVVEHVSACLQRLQIVHALAGSWASSLHGNMRFTHDADICVEPFPDKEDPFRASLGDDYLAVKRHRTFTVINTRTPYKIDLFVAKPRPDDQGLLARRQSRQVGGDAGISIQLVTPEDSILLKLEWYRLGNEVSSQQWADVLGVLQTQGTSLDEGYLDQCAGAHGVKDLLDRAREDAGP